MEELSSYEKDQAAVLAFLSLEVSQAAGRLALGRPLNRRDSKVLSQMANGLYQEAEFHAGLESRMTQWRLPYWYIVDVVNPNPDGELTADEAAAMLGGLAFELTELQSNLDTDRAAEIRAQYQQLYRFTSGLASSPSERVNRGVGSWR